jgi:type IV pilus assembly protein PilB
MPVPIGELLLKEKRISAEQLQQALNRQKANGGKLGQNLVQMGLVKDEEITALLSKQYGVPSINLRQFEIDQTVIKLISAETADRYQVVPLSRTGGTLTIAMTDPTDAVALDHIRAATGYDVEPVVASEGAVTEAIRRYYPTVPTTFEIAGDGPGQLHAALDGDGEAAELRETTGEAPARPGEDAPGVGLVNAVLKSAMQKGASDIHIEPHEQELRVRYRIDGILHTITPLPMKFRDALTSRVKIMASLDIAEKRLPQDGRIGIRFSANGVPKRVDVRVSVLPTLDGEKIVMRLVDRDTLTLDLSSLGFEPESLEKFERAILRTRGMVLVTGPAGSGKTSTLYASIAKITTPETNIMAAEDPVELKLAGVNQVQIDESLGLDFHAAVASLLRQDPDVIFIGEIREVKTAEAGVNAALTGRLVLSSLSANDAPSTIIRLVRMGVEPFLVASSVHLICAQRLVRRVCASCREPHPVPTSGLVQAGFTPEEAGRVTAMKGRGCDRCGQTGFKGRVGLFEVMEVTEELRELILAGASSLELRRRAVEDGMITLRRSGLRKVMDGLTTIEEVVRGTTQ